jgi:hypothetical protein
MFTARSALTISLISSTTRRTAALTSQLAPRTSFTPIRTMASSIPKTMKGVIMESNGGTEVLQYRTDLPVPEPKEGQILIKNDYVGINFIDT